MASSGSFQYNNSLTGNTLILSWSIVSQSVAANTSVISWSASLKAGPYGAFISNAQKDWVLRVDGVWTDSGSTYIYLGSNTSRKLGSGQFSVFHDSDGTKSIHLKYEQDISILYGETNIGLWSVEGTADLDPIYRKSTLSVPKGTLGTSQTMTITRDNSSFVHKISYKCGDLSGYVLGSDTTTAGGTSIKWTPPLNLATQNTTGTTVSVDFVLGTYAGSTLVGYDYQTQTYSIPASEAPSCSFKLTDVTGTDEIYGSPVQGLSRINIDVTATPSYDSPIKEYRITADGNTYNKADATTGTLKSSGASVVTATVRDARGRTGSVSYTMNVKAYTRPNVSALSVHRCDEDGVENDQGEHIKVVFSAEVTNVGSLGINTAAYRLRYKPTTSSDFTEVTFSDVAGSYKVAAKSYIFAAASDNSYDVEVEAQDRHATSVRSTSASTAFTLMHWGNNGTSVGIGKVAERDHALEIGLDMYTFGSRVSTGNKYCLSTPGESSLGGYILMARISVTAANADTPITFVFSQRQAATPMTVHVQLKNTTATTSAVESIRYEGSNYGAFLVKTGALIWDLYVQKGSDWDTITLQDWWTSKTMESRVVLTFPGTMVSSLPGDYYRATPAPLDSLRDYIYPVGSVYISYSHVSPATLFGGTWVRIENAFLWGTTSGGTIGQTGGSSTHTLTEDELPAHSHGSVYSQHADGTKSNAWYTTSGTSIAYGPVSAGGGKSHNNMPPYIQVSIWRRTA